MRATKLSWVASPGGHDLDGAPDLEALVDAAVDGRHAAATEARFEGPWAERLTDPAVDHCLWTHQAAKHDDPRNGSCLVADATHTL